MVGIPCQVTDMKILVTGANGFIGAALCEHLIAEGHEVVPVVRSPASIRNAQVVTSDEEWVCALRGCDSVVHLAGRVHVMREKDGDPLQAFRASNLDITLALARKAAANGVKRFIFSSSIKVNGENTMQGQFFRPDDEPAPRMPMQSPNGRRNKRCGGSQQKLVWK